MFGNTPPCDHTCGKHDRIFIILDGELKMMGVDPRFLVVMGGDADQLRLRKGEVSHDDHQIDWSSGSNTLPLERRL